MATTTTGTGTTGSTGYGATGGNSVTQTDLPAWYQTYTQNLGTQAMNIAQQNNSQPLPQQQVAGFNADQTDAFQAVRNNQGIWKDPLQQAVNATNQIVPTTSKFIDYAQGAVGGPAQTTSDSVQPWAQGAQDAMAGNAQGWTNNWQQYMSPYTSAVVDNIARLGQRNWEDNIMPGINASMIGAGQFGSTRNAEILGRAGVNAANDILGQQSTALQAGYSSGAGIFSNDANRAQQQQKLQSDAAIAGGNLMQTSLAADANRQQQQGQIQANTALQGATTATSALNSVNNNMGALAKSYQELANTDAQSMLNIGNQQQQMQQAALSAAYNNAMAARNDPWTQLSNASSIINGIQIPTSSMTSQSGQVGTPASGLSSAAAAALAAAGLLNADGTLKGP